MIERLTMREVLAGSDAGWRLEAEDKGRVRLALAPLATSTPWYLRAFIGFGAWVGSWFLLSFVLAMLAIPFGGDIDGPTLAVGLALVPAAVVVHRSARYDFLRELALVWSLTGQGLIIGSLVSMASLTVASIAAVVMAVALVPLFADYVHRFLAVPVVAGALMVLVHEWHVPYGGDIVCLALIGMVFGLWREAPESWRSDHDDSIEPLVAGAVVALLGLLLCGLALDTAGVREPLFHHGRTVTAGAALALLWLLHGVLTEHRAETTEVVAVLVAVLALAAITWQTPAIVTTLLVVLLAFDRRSRGIAGLGAAFFIVFGTLYYYNLELTLMQKSGVLTASGGLCLAVWAVLGRRARLEAAA